MAVMPSWQNILWLYIFLVPFKSLERGKKSRKALDSLQGCEAGYDIREHNMSQKRENWKIQSGPFFVGKFHIYTLQLYRKVLRLVY